MEIRKINFNDTLKRICSFYKIDRNNLSSILDCNLSLISLYYSNKRNITYEKAILLKKEVERRNGDIYSFIFDVDDSKYYHGSKEGITPPISASHSNKKYYDFGRGFYVGESFMQSSTFISSYDINKCRVYSLDINLNTSKVLDITPKNRKDYRWIMVVAFFRDYINEIDNPELVKSIKNMLSNYDVIKGPIADDRMTTVMDRFFSNVITDNQLLDSLTRMNLGNQYCFLNEKSCKSIKIAKEIAIDETTMSFIKEYEKLNHSEAIEYANKMMNSQYKTGKTFFKLLKEIKKNKWNLFAK